MNNTSFQITKDLQEIFQEKDLPSDHFLDQKIGIHSNIHEDGLCILDMVCDYGPLHRTYQADTPYEHIRRVYEIVMPYNPKSFLDIGSGNGRLLFYGALLFKGVKFYGIEMVRERAQMSQDLSQELNLDISILNGDVLKSKLPFVDCFCLINSLYPSLMPELLNHLKSHARKKPFMIISMSTCNIIISQQDWLQEIQLAPPSCDEYDLRLFKTII